ncbi:MAG: PKD domain-containing protein, partial [Puniceicoccaceae bacterium]
MPYPKLVLCLAILALTALWVREVRADPAVYGGPMDVVAAFPHDQTYAPGQLLFRQVGLGRIGAIIYHNGYIYTINVGGGARRTWQFLNPNDPASLSIVFEGGSLYTDHGTHGYKKVGRWAGGTEVFIHALSPGVNQQGGWGGQGPHMPESYRSEQQPWPRPEHLGGAHYNYFPWSVPFNWVQYGGGSGQGPIFRAGELLTTWDSLAQHGVAGTAMLLGDVIFVASDGTDQGVLAYDLGPVFQGQQPQLLQKLSDPIGGYLAGIWEHYLILAGGDTDRNLMHVVDIQDPSNMLYITTIDLRGTPALNAGTNVPYVQTQDEFVFTRRHKINMEILIAAQDPSSGYTEADALVLEFDEVGNNRPPGSVSGQLDISQFTLPIGNLMISGSYSFAGRDGVGVWAHQAEPDTRGPYVGYHRPHHGQTNFPLGAPISLVIAETLESFTIANGETVIVRPIGGDPINCWTSVSYDSIVTITPREYLQPDTTYEVIIVEGGIKDVVGNGITGHSFVFSTGSDIVGSNNPPEINSISLNPQVPAPAQSVTVSVDATDPDSDPLEYRFQFGDGSPFTAWSSSSSANHTYAQEGHYEIQVQVRDVPTSGDPLTTIGLATVTVTVPPPAGPRPTASTSIALDAAARKVWVVNRDNDSVTRLDADTKAVDLEVSLNSLLGLSGRIGPRSVAVVPGSGQVWVTGEMADRVAVLNSSGQLVESIATGYGSAPQEVVVSPDGSRVFVTLYAGGAGDARNGQLLRFDSSTRTETGRTELGPTARPIAVSADGAQVYVGRFISTEHHGEIWRVDGNSMSLLNTMPLWRDRGIFEGVEMTGDDGPGVPNFVSSLAISPHGDWLWYTAIKMDTTRGLFFQQGTGFNTPLAHDATVRSVMGRFDLNAPGGPVEPGVQLWGSARGRVDIDNSDSPSALAFSPLGDYVFVALQGNNQVRTFDDLLIRNNNGGQSSVWNLQVGSAPQGLVIDEVTETLWVQNFMSRDVDVVELEDFLGAGSLVQDIQNVVTSTQERLSPEVLEGKQIFYFAGNDPEGFNKMSLEGYISCATCHIDGGHDGQTWDFTQRGEGLRNTIDLRGRGGVAHGNVHWSGNFDEIQDFILDIVNEFGGTGFLPDGQQPNPPLGAPNAGRSAELDNLAAFVTSLDDEDFPRSPHRNSDGTMTQEALFGAQVFQQLNCMSCHNPQTDYTDSTLGVATLHNVGTLRTSSGTRLDEPLTGIDTPTLLGIWDTAPYFHDGSAETIHDVFMVAGGTIYEAEAATGGAVPSNPDVVGGGGAHGTFRLNNASFGGVDGGIGGTGAVEVRYLAAQAGTLRITVNGSHVQTLSYAAPATHFEWRRARFEDVPLAAGAANTVVVDRNAGSGTFGIDNITVSTPDLLALAADHRVAQTLSSTDYDHLITYLLQLDGREPGGTLPLIVTKTLPNTTLSAPYAAEIEVRPGGGTLSWSVTAGALPAGLTLATAADNRTGVLSGTPTEDGLFTFTVQAQGGGESGSRQFTLFIDTQAIPEGFIYREYWLGISGTAVSDLTSNPNYPDNPSGSEQIFLLEGPVNWDDNYGTRIHGFIIPPATGEYSFWISSDDNGELWLSTDDNPANAQLIANVPGWTSSREWNKYAAQRSAPVNLVEGQRYYVRVLHKEGAGGDNVAVGWLKPGESGSVPSEVVPGSVLSPFVEQPQPPAAPTGLAATATAHDSVQLSWTAGDASETGFRIERDSGAGFVLLANVGAGVTSHLDSSVVGSTAYTYRVRAFNAAGNSAWSNQAQTTTPAAPQPPAAPANLIATAVSHAEVQLGWQAGDTSETGFRIERSTGGGSFSLLTEVGAGVTSHADTTVSPETQYNYRVRAFNAHGDSSWSGVATATTPAAPVMTDAVLMTDDLSITWSYGAFGPNNTASGGAYNGWVPQDQWTGGWINDSGSVGSTSVAAVTGAPWGSGNAIRVFKAANAFGSTSWNLETPVPAASQTALGSLTQWDDQGEIPDATLWYRIDTGSISDPRPGGGMLSRTVPEAVRVQLRFFDGGDGQGVSAGNRTVADVTIPSGQLVADGTWRQITLTFNLISASERAALSHDGVSDPDSVTVIGMNLDGPASAVYDVRVARLAIPVPGDPGPTPEPPGAPTGLAATAVSHEEVSLSWTAADGLADGFRIERATGGGSFSLLAEVGPGVASHADTTVSPETQYSYRVRAFNADGNSPWSNTDTITTPAAPQPPGAPTGLAATVVSHEEVSLSWTAADALADGFRIERATGGGSFGLLVEVGPGATSHADTTVSPETQYSYRVRAFNADGDSPWSNTDTVTTPAEPVMGTAVLMTDDLSITWSFGAFGPNNTASGGAYNGWVPQDQWTGGWINDSGSVGSTSVAAVTGAPWGSGNAIRVFKAENAFGSTSWNMEAPVPSASQAALGSLTQWDDQGEIPDATLWYRIDTGSIADPRPGGGNLNRTVPEAVRVQLRFFDGGDGQGVSAGNRTVADV